MQRINIALAVGAALFMTACGGGDDASQAKPAPVKPDPSYNFNEYIKLPADLLAAADKFKSLDIEEDAKIGSRIVLAGSKLDLNSLPYGSVLPYLRSSKPGNWYMYHTPLSFILLTTNMGRTESGQIIHKSIIKEIKGVWTGKDDYDKILGAGGKASYYGTAFSETMPLNRQTGTLHYDIDFATRTGEGYIYGIKSVGDPLFDKRGQLIEDAPVTDGATRFQADLNRIILSRSELEPFKAKYADDAQVEVYGVRKGAAIGIAKKGAIVNKDMVYSFALLGPKAQELVGGVLLPVEFVNDKDKREKYYALSIPFSGVRIDNLTNDQIVEYNKFFQAKQHAAEIAMDKQNQEIIDKRQIGKKPADGDKPNKDKEEKLDL